MKPIKKTLEIRQKILPSNHPDLAVIYNSIGLLHCTVGQFFKALESFHKELEIKQRSLSQNHPEFATVYSNIGLVYFNMNDHEKALEFYQKALEIYLKTLPLIRYCIQQHWYAIYPNERLHKSIGIS